MPYSIDLSKLTLIDKTILITGAGSGIGRHVATACAKLGATLILLGRTVPKLESVYDEILELKESNDTIKQPAIIPMNLQGVNDQEMKQVVDAIEEEYGKLDGLLHNAGTLGNLSPIKNVNLQRWYKTLQTNLNSPMILTHYCIPLLEKSRDASVIFTSSGVATLAKAYWGAYAVSKAATDHLMKILAEEYPILTEQQLAKIDPDCKVCQQGNIRFNSFSPGAVATRMRALAYPGENPQTLTQPQEIVPYYLYLLSTQSNIITGKVLTKEDFTLSQT